MTPTMLPLQACDSLSLDVSLYTCFPRSQNVEIYWSVDLSCFTSSYELSEGVEDFRRKADIGTVIQRQQTSHIFHLMHDI